MQYPLKPITVTNPFGKAGATKWYSFHTGIDLRARYANLYAPEAGTLKQTVSTAGGYGIQLTTATGVHIFWHLKERIRAGKVKEGQKIGVTGNSGKWTTAAHLHWGLKVRGVYVDPLKKVKANMATIKSLEKALTAMTRENKINYAERIAWVKIARTAQAELEALRLDDIQDEKAKVQLNKTIKELNKKLSEVPAVDEDSIVINWFKKLFKRS